MRFLSKKRLIFVAAAFGVNGAAAMTALSCLPDLSPAAVAPLEAGGDGGPPVLAAVCGDGILDLDAGEQCDPGEAGSIGCSACKIQCDDGGLLDDKSGHCYFALAPSVTYDQAVAACDNVGAHLVTFASEDEFQKVIGWNQTPFWVGLQDSIGTQPPRYKAPVSANEPGWSGICTGCFGHVDAGARDFPRNGKEAGTGTLGCVGAEFANGPWYTIPCNLRVFVPGGFGVVCEREPAGFTAHGCIGGTCLNLRVSGKRYIYVANPKATAQEAFNECRALGSLVVFNSREEREALAKELLSVLPRSPAPQVWVGLTRAQGVLDAAIAPGAWTWADGQPLASYAIEWAEAEPKLGNFAWMSIPESLYDTQLLHGDDGTAKLPYVCELH